MIRGKVLPVKNPAQVILDTSIHNRFDIEVIDSKTGKIKQKAEAFNVVCNGLWTCLNKGFTKDYYSGWFRSIAYGTGTGTPSENDSDLFNKINKLSGQHAAKGIDYKNCNIWVRKDISILETEAVGETITEVGIVDDGDVLCTHAMLQDMNGNQISIEKTDTDIINIYATVFIHFAPELLDVNNPVQINIDSINRDFSILTIISGVMSSEANTFKKINLLPAKGRVLPQATYDNEKVNTLTEVAPIFDIEKKTVTYSGRFAAVNNNVSGGFGWVVTTHVSDNVYVGRASSSLILKAVPPLFNGSTIVGEAIGTGDGVTTDFATKFDLPRNAKIYVDGVLQENVAVDCVPLSYNKMGQYFQDIDVKDGVAYPKLPIAGKDNDSLDSDKIGSAKRFGEIFYNPFFEYGIKSFEYDYYGTTGEFGDTGAYISNDLENWIKVSKSPYVMPEEYKNYKYFKLVSYDSAYSTKSMHNFLADSLDGKNIHFSEPPAEGAVITADYETSVIAKDSNHVFDISIVIQFGEHNEL